MGYKAFSLFSFTLLLLLLLLPLHSHATSRNSHDKKSSPFEFLKHLQGCHKGEKVKGIHNLKTYLHTFGYLSYNHSKNHTHTNDDDDFDELLESAIKSYQLNYHLNATGTLDAKTVSTMMMPRCGVADIINGTNLMQSGKKKHHQHHHGSLHTVSHYAFIPGNPKWPSFYVPSHIWAQDYTNANIKVGFHRRDHGDGSAFDGAGGILAHAYPPSDGRFHYDADERWSVGAVPNAFDLETVALHEIGHLLGLDHSEVEGAIMWPTISSGRTQGLHRDDIDGIKALYNV
uniref:Peptidase metallopeptidase domain-containing protein n=1 Tax=Fagus sylvatica TaxID=28930 RepID=A0A2N9HK91_FAGSY